MMELQEQMDKKGLLGPGKKSERESGNLILVVRKLRVPRKPLVPDNSTLGLRKLREPDKLKLVPSKRACAWESNRMISECELACVLV